MMAINPEESLAHMQGSRPQSGCTGCTLQDLLAETSKYLAPQDMERIEHAFELANQAHMGALRRSGEAYIQHPLEVALLLADMRIDADGIIAALLHDVVEDTDHSLEEIRRQFGDAVANIVDGVTKFEALVPTASLASTSARTTPGDPQDDEQRQQQARELKRRQRSETVRKMLLAMAEDPRVVVLKLADRLHNMRTLGVMDPLQQQNKARETVEIYVPLARRLGMARVQAELEDLALSYLEPERYAWLARAVEEERRKQQPYVDEVLRILREEMERAGIHAEVLAWQKHLASINRKLQQSGTELSQLHDLVSFRILVDNDQDCYLALGHIHALWRPKDGRIKDFIATPKLNGYQSLHTTVFCLDNRLAEIQIRTHDMQRTADYGIASYWYLKERNGSRLSYQEMIAWIEQLREWQRELPQNADEFVEAVKGDIFQEQIFVFTPKGEVKDLPRGSTVLDMAYRIHTDIGDHCAGARIITSTADRLVTRLVPLDYQLQGGEIVDIIVNRATHPTRDWLAFVRTTTARTKIRRYLRTYEREINLQPGRERPDQVHHAAIVKLAHCCYPIPGDSIVGLLQPGRGVYVHQSNCSTLRRYREQAGERIVEINWLQIKPQKYQAPITIVAHDRAGLLRDVAAVVSDAGINMTAVTSSTNASLQKAVITATLEIDSVELLDQILKRLRQVKNVVSVSRAPAKGTSSNRRIE